MRILGVVASSSREVPNAPTIGTATDVGTGRAFNNGAATVTFTAPTWTGGLPITGYTVTSSPGGFTGTGASSPITVTGLQSNTNYTFTVRATNAVGQSAASAASNSILATTVPQAPTIGTATDLGTGSSVSVAFTGNATGGKAISTYTATSSPSSITGASASSPITVSGLTTGTAYTFTVTATNANGTSVASAASNSVTPAVPSSYESIATFTSTGVSTMTFSSIPQGYKHLQIRLHAKGDQTNFPQIRMRINGVASSGSYSWHAISGGPNFGSVVAQANINDTSIRKVAVLSGSGTTDKFGVSVIDIIDYSSTSKNKTIRGFYGNETNSTLSELGQISGAFYSTNAVSSITLFTDATSSFVTGTSIALYGIKG